MVLIKSTPLELTRRKNRPPSLFTYTYTYTSQAIPSSLSFTQAINNNVEPCPTYSNTSRVGHSPLLVG